MSTQVRAQNTQSLTSVKAIKDATDESARLLGEMEQAAEDAGTTLTQIYQDAADAQTSASAAQQSALSAQTSAFSALEQLGIVENVVGVLDLLSQHATYSLTQDTSVVSGKWYFTRSGTSPDYVYTVVTNPSGNPAQQGYYELDSIDESVRNYLTSRIAVTGEGMWLQDPNMQTKILLSASDGVVLYGTNGQIVGKYGQTAQVGDSNGFHIEISGTELGFYQAQRKVAYISNNQLYITQTVVLQQMDLGLPVSEGGLGQWSWKVHKNQNGKNNLNLKWIG